MKASLCDYLDLLDPWISPQLIAPPYFDRIKKIGRELPVLSFGCFECRLGADESRVDFNMGINGKLNEHKAYFNWLANERLVSEPGNEKILPIFLEWKEDNFPLRSMIYMVWFVYDILDPSAQSPEPWIYIHFRKTKFDTIPQVRSEIILQLLPRLDTVVSSAYLEKYRHFLDSIPASIQIMAIGSPGMRGGGSLRVYLVIETFQELAAFLDSNHWLGNVPELKDKIAEIEVGGFYYGLSFNVGPDSVIQPGIGIEIWFEDQQQLSTITQNLVNHRLCTDEKQEALLRWKGEKEMETHPEIWSWPDSYEFGANPKQVKIVIRRMIRYIKIIYQPQSQLLAKAYLFFDRPIRQI